MNEEKVENIQKAYKFRIYPNSTQISYFAKAFGHTRWLYNRLLSEKSAAWSEREESVSKGVSQSRIVELKKDPEFSWLSEVHSQTLQGANHQLFLAFDRFFKKLSGYPKFKKRRGRQSFSVPQNFQMDASSNWIKIPKLKTPIKTVFHRSLKNIKKVNSFTISMEPSGKYYVSIQVEEFVKTKTKAKTSKKSIGVDLGISHFVTDSDGNKTENPKYFRTSERKLKRAQRSLSRKAKGSSKRNKQRLRVARLHEKIKNQRLDFLHKESSRLVNENQVIFLEDLGVNNMMRNRHLSKSIADASWGEFARQLKYKAQWHGSTIVQIGKFEPSSKTCSECGHKVDSLPLSVREWTCENCGAIHDRDVNAAKNIKLFGQVKLEKQRIEEKLGRDTPEVTPVERTTTVVSKRKSQVGSKKREPTKGAA